MEITNTHTETGIFPDLDWAIPALKLTDQDYLKMVNACLNGTEMKLCLYLMGNKCIETGALHQFTIAELAEKMRVDPKNFYGSDGYIANIEKTGIFHLKKEGPKLGGTHRMSPKKRNRRKSLPHPFPLRTVPIHTAGLNMLFAQTRCRIDITLFLLLAFHTDKTTGTLNTNERPKAWAAKIGCARIIVERAIDKLSDLGVWQITRDYLVKGVHNFVQMGEGFLRLHTERKIEKNKDAKIEKIETGVDYTLIQKDLYEFFGINATGWMKSHLDSALRRLLSFRMEAHKKHIAELKASLQRPHGVGARSLDFGIT